MKKTIILIALITSMLLILSGTSAFYARPAENDAQAASEDLSEWSDSVRVSDPLPYSVDPKVAADEADNVHVVWVQTEDTVFYNRSDSQGNWQSPVNVTGNSIKIGEGPWPEIQVDNNGVPVVVFSGKIGGNYEAVMNRYYQGRWTGGDNVSKTPRGGSAYPTLAIDRNTNTYFVFWQDDEFRESESQTYWQILCRFKEEGEGAWKGGGVLPEPNNRAYAPQAGMDAKGKAYIIYANRAQRNKSRIFFTENATPKDWTKWSPVIDLSGATGISFAYPQVAVDLAGNVYVTWMHIVNGNVETFFKKRVNGVWTPMENLSQSPAASGRPSVAVNNETGDVYVVWEEDADVLLRKLSGGKWGDPVIMSGQDSITVHPYVFCSPSGAVHLVYSDRKSGQWNIYHRSKSGRPPEPPVEPIGVSVATVLDETTTPNTKSNTVRWEENPENAGKALANYLVYRKEEGQSDAEYQLIATVPLDTFSYLDVGLATDVKFAYAFATMDVVDQESGLSDPIYENRVFVPLDVELMTEINRTLFMSEKINTVSWSNNPLNDPIQDRQHNIYRKAIDDEGPMSLVHTASSSTFSYIDRGLSASVLYQYSVTVIDGEGHETPKGKTIVSEEDD
ncbi:hypothetical protein ACFLT2_14760 [Acidobacteriota bacterium]